MAQYPVTTDAHPASLGVKLYLGTSLVVFLLMMLAGLLMRATQANWLEIPPDIFYQLMTAHGAGMVGISGFAGAAIMWHFLGRYVQLNPTVLFINFGLFLVGVVLILGSIFLGGYAGGWTFLWPLPAKSMGIWSAHAAASFVGGLLLIGVGFLIFYLDAGIAITKKYGSV
jgi:cytochrome c oxidase subunit 1